MATHFMRILSRMMVPGPARTPSRPDVRAGGGGGGGGSRATPTPLGSPIPPAHTQDCYPVLQGSKQISIQQSSMKRTSMQWITLNPIPPYEAKKKSPPSLHLL